MTSRNPLLGGARPALLAALYCTGLCACVADGGDLFPAIVTTAPVEAPGAEAPAAGGTALAGDAASDGASVPGAVTEAAPEQTVPSALDPGAGDGPGGAAVPESPAPTRAESDGAAESDGSAEPAAPSEPEPLLPPPPVVAEAPDSAACAAIADPLLLDFAAASADPAQALFGDFQRVLSGGTYVYPLAPDAARAGLRSDVTDGDWHISGAVAEQSGFGVFLDCQLLDASGFSGLAFRVSGNVERAGSITLLIGTAGNDVSAAWLLENDGASPPGSGRCTPAQSEYDGTCTPARLEIAVSPQAREVIVPFAALSQGSPEPGVNPAEITTIAWALPSPGVDRFGDVQPYAVDLRIDDIRLVEGPASATPLASGD